VCVILSLHGEPFHLAQEQLVGGSIILFDHFNANIIPRCVHFFAPPGHDGRRLATCPVLFALGRVCECVDGSVDDSADQHLVLLCVLGALHISGSLLSGSLLSLRLPLNFLLLPQTLHTET